MTADRRGELVEDIIQGLANGDVARVVPDLSIERMDDGAVLEVDLGDPDLVYIVTVTSYERLD